MHYTEDLSNVYIKCPICDPSGRRADHLGVHKTKPIYNCFRCGFKGRRDEDLRKLESILFGSSLSAIRTRRQTQTAESKPSDQEVLNCLHYDLYKDTRFDKAAINRLMKFFVEKHLQEEYFDVLLELYKEMFETQQAALTPLKNLPDAYKDRLVFFSRERMWASGRALSKEAFPKFKVELLSSAKVLDWSIDIRGVYFPLDKKFDTVYISEGPLDALSMFLLSFLMKKEDSLFYSPGGVNLFRSAIDSIRPSKRVVILPDKDQDIKLLRQLFYRTERDYYLMTAFFSWPAEVGKDPQDLLSLPRKRAKEKVLELFEEDSWIYIPKKSARGKLSFYSQLTRALKNEDKNQKNISAAEDDLAEEEGTSESSSSDMSDDRLDSDCHRSCDREPVEKNESSRNQTIEEDTEEARKSSFSQ